MSKLTVEQVKLAKKEMETQITNIIEEFQNRTGMYVDYIHSEHKYAESDLEIKRKEAIAVVENEDQPRYPEIIGVNVHTQIRL